MLEPGRRIGQHLDRLADELVPLVSLAHESGGSERDSERSRSTEAAGQVELGSGAFTSLAVPAEIAQD